VLDVAGEEDEAVLADLELIVAAADCERSFEDVEDLVDVIVYVVVGFVALLRGELPEGEPPSVSAAAALIVKRWPRQS
jgi:hypothetical protein